MTGGSAANAKKLHIEPGARVLALNAPAGYEAGLDPLPAGATLTDRPDSGDYHVVHLFVWDREEVEQHAPIALQSLRPGGVLWVSYPKRSSQVKTDLTRDAGWETLWSAGMQAVSQIAIDETWSALRFRPKSESEG